MRAQKTLPDAEPPRPAAEWVRIGDLLPWERNPKAHPVENVAEIARSIVRFGFTEPIICWGSRKQVVAGHGRLLAAQMLYREDSGRKVATDQPGQAATDPADGLVPVRWIEFASDHEAAAYAVADNRLTEKNPMDPAQVAEIFLELDDAGVSLDGLGYGEEELRIMLDPPEEPTNPSPTDDDAPAVDEAAPPDSQPGQVYELGPHRLVCGDSRDAGVWTLLMGQERLQMVWTDPPYGVDMAAVNEALAKTGRCSTTREGHGLQNDALKPAELEQFLRDALGITAAHCQPGAAWYVASPPGALSRRFQAVLEELEILRQGLIWVKPAFVLGRSDYHYRHEPIFYGWTPGAAHYFVDERTHDTVMEFDKPSRNADHPTMKPVALVAYCINNSSKPGWLVGEPFGGSGTTLIAAAQTGRIARVIELDPKYCDVIRRRWTKWAKEHGKPVGSGGLE